MALKVVETTWNFTHVYLCEPWEWERWNVKGNGNENGEWERGMGNWNGERGMGDAECVRGMERATKN